MIAALARASTAFLNRHADETCHLGRFSVTHVDTPKKAAAFSSKCDSPMCIKAGVSKCLLFTFSI